MYSAITHVDIHAMYSHVHSGLFNISLLFILLHWNKVSVNQENLFTRAYRVASGLYYLISSSQLSQSVRLNKVMQSLCQNQALNLMLFGPKPLPLRIIPHCLFFVDCFSILIFEELGGTKGKYYTHFAHQILRSPKVTQPHWQSLLLKPALQIQLVVTSIPKPPVCFRMKRFFGKIKRRRCWRNMSVSGYY